MNNLSLDCQPLKAYFIDVPRDNHYDNFLLSMIVINAVMAALASCSNAVVIYTISRTPSLQTPSNILILGLAISDLSVGIFSQPSFCLLMYSEFRRDLDLYCSLGKVYIYSLIPLAALSFLTLTAITADRFLAVHLHLRYQDIITTKRAGIALGFNCFFSVCFAVYTKIFYDKDVIFVFNGCVFAIVLILNVFFIVRVCLVIRKQSLQIQAQQPGQQTMNMARNRKSVMVMFLVIGGFLLCYLPYGVIQTMMGMLEYSYGVRIGSIISESLVMCNAVLNPIIYCWRIEEIRGAAMLLMRKMCRSNGD